MSGVLKKMAARGLGSFHYMAIVGIFCLIFMKLGRKIFLNDLDEYEKGSGWLKKYGRQGVGQISSYFMAIVKPY